MNRPETNPDEGLFDFITNADFKANLITDYEEVRACVKGGLWKGAHVLAGSIIEAMLIDYLIAVKYNGVPDDELLKYDLGKAIPAGEQEGILTKKTAQLSAAVKDYRNLIHPGRVVRLKEKVDEDGATIALSLVKIVAREIGQKKAEKYGCTAEQLVRKLDCDSGCLSYLPHIVRDMNETEKYRLLLEVLPNHNFEVRLGMSQDVDEGPSYPDETVTAYEQCFRHVLGIAPLETRQEIVAQYVRILKEQTSHYREWYEETFFRWPDLKEVANVMQVDIIMKHVQGRLKQLYDPLVLRMAEGIGQSITPDMVNTPLVKALLDPLLTCPEHKETEVMHWIRDEFRRMDPAIYKKMLHLMHELADETKMSGHKDNADLMHHCLNTILF